MCMLGCSIFWKEAKCSGVLSYVCLYLEYTPHSEEKTHFADTSTKFNMTAHVKLKHIQPLVYDQMHRYKIYSQQIKFFFFGARPTEADQEVPRVKAAVTLQALSS